MIARMMLMILAIGASACEPSDDELVGAKCELPLSPCGGTLNCNPTTHRCVKGPPGVGGGTGAGGGGSQGGGGGGGAGP